MYGVVLYGTAYWIPEKMWPIRVLFGYAGLAILGLTLLSVFVPPVADLTLFILNGGIRLLWELTE